MPTIKVKEQDLTSGGIVEYDNYSVVVPGFHAIEYATDGSTVESPFNDDGIYECESAKDFIKYVGIVDPDDLKSDNGEYNNVTSIPHYGNQIAYLLLSLGYQVIYKDLGLAPNLTTDPDDLGAYYAALSRLAETDFWEPLYDKGNYDFRFVITGLGNSTNLLDGSIYGSLTSDDINAIYSGANACIANLAGCVIDSNNNPTGRGDCTALIDVDKTAYIDYATEGQSKIVAAMQNWVKEHAKYTNSTGESGSISQYVGIYAPAFCYSGLSSYYTGSTKYTNTEFPAYMHYLVCFRTMLNNDYAEWFAASGLTRGLGTITIDSTCVPIGEIAMNKLQPRTAETPIPSVNTIMKIRSTYYLWGNRTAHWIDSDDLIASHFMNIRQLCSTLKKQIYLACKTYSFDPNSDILWANFCNMIRPTLERMKAGQGITTYKFVKVATDKKALLKAKIIIRPIEAVEDFDITVVLSDDDTVSVEG